MSVFVFSGTSFSQSKWFDTGKDYLKIFIYDEGICRLDHALLSKYIDNINSIDPSTFKILNKGNQIPIFVSGESDNSFDQADYIEFVSHRHSGEETYFDLYSFYNVYWLTWGDDDGSRVNIFDSSPVSVSDTADYYFDTLHYETETFYHAGSSSYETQKTSYGEDEGWYIGLLYPDQSFNVDFNINDIAAVNQGEFTLDILLRGITLYDNMGTDHFIRFYVNDNFIGERQFAGLIDTLFNFNGSISLLNEGENVLKITSVKTTDENDVILPDWFELTYPRLYNVSDRKMKFSRSENNSSYIEFSGLGTDRPVIYNYEGDIKLTDFVTEQVGSEYNIKFRIPDNFRTFYIFQPDGIIIPDSLKSVIFYDYYNSNNSGEYVIVTHKNFTEAAEELADHRGNDLAAFVADIENIYDEFNYGIPSPYALREFFETSVNNWTVPPRYAVLIGDANVYQWGESNFIPSYGYPCSDGWFVSTDGGNDIIPDIIIGRIPAKTSDEAQNFVSKIKEYESSGFEKWNKNLTFLNGGANDYEQNTILRNNTKLANNYLAGFPFGGYIKSYNKTAEVVIEYGFSEDIVNDINTGTLLINSFGHAAHQRFDIDFKDPGDLQNKGKYPLIVSWSCRTGQFNAQQINSSAESYTLISDKGCIGYIGTTGWGNLQIDELFSTFFFGSLFTDAGSNPAVALNAAKDSLMKTPFAGTQSVINTILQYNYIGDPYLKLKVPEKVDFSLEKVPETDIELPTESVETLKTNIFIHNYGILSADSVTLKIAVNNPENQQKTEYIKFLSKFFIDTVEYDWEISGIPGEHTIDITIDPFNEITELSESNNIKVFKKRVFKKSLVIEKPMNYSILHENNVEFVVSLPKNIFAEKSLIYFEVDTTDTFENPLIQSGAVEEGNITTKFNAEINLDHQVYFWRARTELNGEYSTWVNGVFYTDFYNSLQGDLIFTNKIFGFCEGDSVKIDDDVTLDKKYIKLNVNSAGFVDGDAASIIVNNDEVKIELYDSTAAVLTVGIKVAVIDSAGRVSKTSWFNTYSYSLHSDGLINFLNSVETGKIVLAGIKDTGSRYLSATARQALQSIGSQYAFDIGFRQSWAIIGRKGAAAGTVIEELKPAGEGSVSLFDSIAVFYSSGTVEFPQFTGITEYSSLKWSEGDNISFSVLGYKKDESQWVTALDNLESPAGSDLSSINTGLYSRVKLKADLFKDQTTMPLLDRVLISAQKAGDAVTNFSLIQTEKDTVLE
ncbi:C25 family cysteine peptidase, partial [candidate division KSB1 bacterium]